MFLGKVIGTVTPAISYEGLEGVPMLIVQPLDKKQQPVGEPLVACDATVMAVNYSLTGDLSAFNAPLAIAAPGESTEGGMNSLFGGSGLGENLFGGQ